MLEKPRNLWLYEIMVAVDRSETDGRPFPSVNKCYEVIEKCFPGQPKPAPGVWLPLTLTADEIVKFHHVRREHGCCPRIKWHVVGGPGECRCNEEITS